MAAADSTEVVDSTEAAAFAEAVASAADGMGVAPGTAAVDGVVAVDGAVAITLTAVMAGTAADGMATDGAAIAAGDTTDGDQDSITVALTTRIGAITTTAIFATIIIIAGVIPTATTEMRDAGPQKGPVFRSRLTYSNPTAGLASMLAEKPRRIEN